jgi:exopolysaccharide biosynthesis polyprenyl glycosylphosphotransferase
MSAADRSVTMEEAMQVAPAAPCGERPANVGPWSGRRGVRRRGWLVRRALLVADILGLTLAFLAAHVLFADVEGSPDRVGERFELLLFLATLPGWIVVTKLYGLYDGDESRTDSTTADDVIPVFHMVTVGVWLLFVGAWVTALAMPSFAKVMTFWALAIVLISLGRASARAFCRRRPSYLQNTLIVGAGDVGVLVARKLIKHSEYGLNLLGFVDASAKALPEDLSHLPMLGPPEDLPALVGSLHAERVVIAFPEDSFEQTLSLVRSLADLPVRVEIVPRLYEVVGPSVGIHMVEGLPLIGLPFPGLSRSSRLLKRATDLGCSALGLVALAPFFAVIALAIKLDSRGPVFFRQVRTGCRGQTFRILKFRTMEADADARKAEFAHLNVHARNGGRQLFKIANDPRVTRVGRFLRRYSLDEFPQLINVLRGEMSLVGPRPLVPDEHRYVDGWERKRLDLKPGMTGLWQVLGRSGIPFEEMLKLDYVYVTEWSLSDDLKLILRTVPELVRSRHAY